MDSTKHRWGVRYTSQQTHDLNFLQAQVDANPDFARPGELFLNEPLQQLLYCDSLTGMAKAISLAPKPPAEVLDALLSEIFIITLTQNYTLAPIANPQVGAEYTLVLKQNSTGGHLISFDPLYALQNLDINLDPNSYSVIKALWTGSEYICTNYELTAQLNERDTSNRARENHTGTQAISTVANLQALLDSKEPTITLGTTTQYFRGDKTFQTLDKNAVGLSNVDNTADVDKVISSSTQTALNNKQDLLVSGSNIKTIEGQSILGVGNIDLTKSDVGLSNVDNTSDLSKPISTSVQSAFNLKANLNSPTFTGQLALPNNSRINDIEHFYQTTKPITRGDGSALITGDRWWKTDEGSEWFWNGTYWLSVVQRIMSRGREAVNSGNNSFPSYTLDSDVRDVPARKPLFLEKASYSIILNSLGDEDNYRQYQFAFRGLTGNAPPLYTSPVKLFGTLDRIFILDEPVNIFFNPSSNDGNNPNNQFGFTFNIVGVGISPPNGTRPAGTLYFREVFL